MPRPRSPVSRDRPAAPAGAPGEKVCLVDVAGHDSLESAFREARQRISDLVPASLPQQVVIKPNLCDFASWETGATTDPRWLNLLADEMRAIRPDVIVRCVESDAISAYRTHRACEDIYRRLGYEKAAREARVELLNLSRMALMDLKLPGVPFPVAVPELFLEEMYLISIANLKVHPYQRMTGILKNGYGLIVASDRSHLHPYLATLLPELYRLMTPDLSIIDGRIGLEGMGPVIGDPVRMNTLIVGRDGLAVDEVACRLMGIPPGEVPHLGAAARLFGREFGRVRVIGELRPRKFAFDPQGVYPTIKAKFASQRAHDSLRAFSNRWIDRLMRFRKHPIAFVRNGVSKLLVRRRAA